jgi:hypothetical protein
MSKPEVEKRARSVRKNMRVRNNIRELTLVGAFVWNHFKLEQD